jgi:hypothetical protein
MSILKESCSISYYETNNTFINNCWYKYIFINDIYSFTGISIIEKE